MNLGNMNINGEMLSGSSLLDFRDSVAHFLYYRWLNAFEERVPRRGIVNPR